jgi:hypothetical protein
MAILTKAQLEALNQSSFPDNSTEAITPEILRTYNTATIDTLVDSLDTGSFTTDAEFNAFTSSTNSSITQLNASSASQQISINALNAATSSYATSAITASSLITASVSGQTLTFTKGDASTFDVTLPAGSGSSTIPTGTVSSSAQIVELGFLQTSSFNAYTTSTDSSITQLNASSASQQISINALNTNSGSVNSSITQLNASSASQQISINELNTTSASLNTSASLGLTTASFSGNTLTFTKGNGTTFGVVIPDVSGSTLPSGLLSSSVTNFTDYSASVDSRINAITASGGIPAGTISGSSQITALGFVSSSVTASSLVTASFSGNTLTFTKGDASTFGVVIPDVSGSTGTTIYEVVYTGENITKGDPLYISGSQGANPIVYKADAADAAKMPVTFVSNETIGVNNTTNAIVLGLIEGIDLTGYTAGQAIYVAEGGGWSTSLPSGSNSVTQLLGVVTKGGSGGKGMVLNPGPAQLPGLDTGKFWVGNGSNQPIEISSASFATTGSNVFTGDQTLTDEAGNTVTLSDISGSLVLVAKGVTSGSAGLSNITASASNLVNLIFKGNNLLSGSTIISGSNNLFVSPSTPTAGFRRQINAGNIMLTGQIPEVTGSAAYQVVFASNYANNIMRLRGPVSSSAWIFSNNIVNANLNVGNADATSANQAIAGGSITNNILLSSVNYNAYTTPLVTTATFTNNLAVGSTNLTSFSSSIQAVANIFNGNTFAVNNSYFGTSSTNAAQRLALSYNVFGGINSSTLTTSGSNTTAGAAREVIGNTTNGSGILLGAVLNGDSSNLYSTLIHGSNLTVTGSSLHNTYANAGSTFIGRNNSVNGTAARSGETVFAVGTGTNSAAGRKTGFLIDSGSNTFVEGTLNVSGSTSFNGAVNITGSTSISGAVSVTGSLTTSDKIQAQGINIYTGSQQGIYIGDKNNFNPATTGVPSEYSHTVIGQGALNAFLLGDRNTVVGRAALKSMTTGSDNLAFGAFAGEGLISGSSNFFVGTGAGSGVERGSNNFFLGNAAGNQFRSGSGNLIIGPALGTQFVSGSGNLIIGQYGSKVVDNVDKQFSLTYGQTDGGRTNLFYKSGSESANLYLYGGLEIQNELRLSRGSDKPSGIVSVGSSGATVTNSLVTTDSIILVTTQNSSVGGDEYPAVVGTKSAGSFTVSHNYGGTLEVGYLIINQTP